MLTVTGDSPERGTPMSNIRTDFGRVTSRPVPFGTVPKCPNQLGYRMPAEWEPHESTWLAWPRNPETWSHLEEIESIYIEIISILTRGEKVKILVNDSREERQVFSKLSKNKIRTESVQFFQIKTHDAWIRDYGPNLIVKEESGKKKLAVNRWIFNAWGSKYEEHLQDDVASQQILDWLKLPIFETNFVLEGGSIDHNGKGVILTTEQCLLNPNRNPGYSKEKIETILKNYLCAKHIIWLGNGIEGDDTDGHVDDIARFVNSSTVLAAVESNPKDNNYKPLHNNLKRLQKSTNQNGKKLNVIELPMPGRIDAPFGRLPASYANFYIGNSAVLIPIFDDPNDKPALRIIESVFSGRHVIGIRSEALMEGLGGIHCLTHEQPAI